MATTPTATTTRPSLDSAGTIARRRLGFTIFPSAVVLLLMAASAPSPFYPQLQQRLGIAPIGITLVFAVYAIALLISLLTVGSLSDHVGRRPVVTAGFVVLASSMLLFWHADSTGLLFAARAVQGLAGGALVSALSAAVTDFAPPARPGRAALLNTLAPMAGLALGALVSGVVLDVSTHAMAITFGAMTAAYLAIALLVWTVPETSTRAEGWRAALRPRAAVPASARRIFVISVPILGAGWATGGLFFSLGPDIVAAQLGLRGHVIQAVVLAVLPVFGGIAVLGMQRRTARTTTIFAAVTLAVGTALSLVALAAGSTVGYLLAIAVTGLGFGTGLMGVIASLTPKVATHQRAELFAALYTAAYLAFGVPTVVAGALVPTLGLTTTNLAYGLFVVASATLAAVARAVHRDSRS